MSNHRYILEPYKGMNTRYRCPGCQQRDKTFSLYIDTETGEHIHHTTGRCNRENNCGYHYTPKQYFRDNITQFDKFNPITNGTELISKNQKAHIQTVHQVDYMSLDEVEKSISDCTNDFNSFLIAEYGIGLAWEVIKKYFLGTSPIRNGRSVIFWRIDEHQRIRTGKIMYYDPLTGKRIKDEGYKWVHNSMKNFNFQQCFFGQHLLFEHPNKPVHLVESEKTAIIASIHMPHFNWIATGGSSGCKWREYSVFKVFENKNVILYPDFGFMNVKTGKTCFQDWKERADVIKLKLKANISVSRFLEDSLLESERSGGYDLADFLLQGRKQKNMQ